MAKSKKSGQGKSVKLKEKKKKPSKPARKEAAHPKGKKGVTISSEKYDLIRQHIISHIWRDNEISFKKLISELEEKLSENFDGSVSWYVTWVKMDLETKGIIEQVPDKKPQHLRLKQRLNKPED